MIPEVPEGVDLTWPVLIFLITIVCSAAVGSWKIFNVRKADHEKITADIKAVEDSLEDKIEQTRKHLEEKSDSKFDSMVNAIGRVEKNAKDNYDVLHGRVNKNVEEIGSVTSKVEYQRGVTDTMKEFMLNQDQV